MFEDRIQDLDSATCGIFQIYFYDNLSIYRRKQQNPKRNKVKKSTVETLLNELFSLNDKDNEIKMEEYADKIGVKILYSKNCILI